MSQSKLHAMNPVKKAKQFPDVASMVRDVSDDTAFSEEFEKHLAQKQIVKLLMALRAAQGLSQRDIADKFPCTQSFPQISGYFHNFP